MSLFNGLIDVIIYLLIGHPMAAYSYTVNKKALNTAWQTALHHQTQIGWKSFLQGFWHSSWIEVQRIHVSLLPIPPMNDYWMTTVIHTVLLYIYDC